MKPSPKPIAAVCDYILSSDVEGTRWLTKMLDKAIRGGLIRGYNIDSVIENAYGLELLTFRVEVDMPLAMCQSDKRMKKFIRKRVEEIFYDKGVSVRMLHSSV